MQIFFQKTKKIFCRVCGCLSQGDSKKIFQRTTKVLRQAFSGLSGEYLAGVPCFSQIFLFRNMLVFNDFLSVFLN